MSGKPAARMSDMTKYGGPIVQGSAGVLIGAPTGVACSVCPNSPIEEVKGHPVNHCWEQRYYPVRRILRCPARCRSSLPAPTTVTGRKRPRHRGCSAPAGRCLLICTCNCVSGN